MMLRHADLESLARQAAIEAEPGQAAIAYALLAVATAIANTGGLDELANKIDGSITHLADTLSERR